MQKVKKVATPVVQVSKRVTDITQQVESILNGLSRDAVEKHSRSGAVQDQVGTETSIVHVYGQWYPWEPHPHYYACKKFYSIAKFSEVAGSKQLRQQYNASRTSKEHVKKFHTVDEVAQFIITKD